MSELDLEAIRARHEAATPGPWHWAGNTDVHRIYLANWTPGLGRCTIMDFSRWGMQSARPRFAEDLMMVDADKRAVYEVAKAATSRLDPRVYRADISSIDHPDAVFIAHARADIPALLAEVGSLRAKLAAVEGWQRSWSDSEDRLLLLPEASTELVAILRSQKSPTGGEDHEPANRAGDPR